MGQSRAFKALTSHRTSRIAAISIICMLCIAAACMLSSCGGPTPTQTANTYLLALQTGDSSKAKDVYAGNATIIDAVKDTYGSSSSTTNTTASNEEMNKTLTSKLQGFDFSLGQEKIDGDKATVEVTITTYNMSNALSNFISKYMQQGLALAFSGATEEQMSELATQIFTNEISNTSKDYKKTVQLNMSKKDGKWIVDELSTQRDFVDALTGGLLSSAESYSKAFGGSNS